MPQKKSEHIIDYINRKTIRDPKAEFWKHYARKNKKYPVDKSMFLCVFCNKVWNKVPKWIDPVRWRYFPKGIIPTYNKQRKKCPNCIEFIKNDKK